jgi:hypothetical protein
MIFLPTIFVRLRLTNPKPVIRPQTAMNWRETEKTVVNQAVKENPGKNP